MSRHLTGMMYQFFEEIAAFFAQYIQGNSFSDVANNDALGFPSGEENWSKALVKIKVFLPHIFNMVFLSPFVSVGSVHFVCAFVILFITWQFLVHI